MGLTSAHPSAKRADIQGLRAFAVLVVILDHLFHWPAGGFSGVDMFFVISGFLITGLLLREWERTEHISFLGFYSRRIRRIIPAATLVLICTVIAAQLVAPVGVINPVEIDAVYAFLFVSNWHFLNVGTDYFQQDTAALSVATLLVPFDRGTVLLHMAVAVTLAISGANDAGRQATMG